MNRRPIKYVLVAGDILGVKQEVKRLVEEEGWWLHGELIYTSIGCVARELVKYEPLTAVTSSGHVVKED